MQAASNINIRDQAQESVGSMGGGETYPFFKI